MGEVTAWAVADASNIDLFPENMPFGDVNDSGRAVQGAIARWFKDWNGSIVASGSSGAYTITSNRTIASYANNEIIWWRANHTNTGAVTLNLNGIGAKDVIRATGSALTAGDITSGQIVGTYYNSSLDDWVLITPAVQGSASDAATGLIELAIQSEMKAAADVARAVTPGRQHFHPGHPKAGGNFNGGGTPAFVAGDYGMGAITDNGTGDYTLALDTAFANTNFWMNGWARFDTNLASCGLLSADSDDAKTASTLQVKTMNAANASLLDLPEAGISFWGDYA